MINKDSQKQQLKAIVHRNVFGGFLSSHAVQYSDGEYFAQQERILKREKQENSKNKDSHNHP